MASHVLAQISGEARSVAPRECCGILLGEGACITQAIPAANIHPQPQTHFEIEPQALIDAHRAAREGGLQVLGYYHSHPTGDPRPSITDQAMAAGDGRIWAIAAGSRIGWWRDGAEGFEAVTVIEG